MKTRYRPVADTFAPRTVSPAVTTYCAREAMESTVSPTNGSVPVVVPVAVFVFVSANRLVDAMIWSQRAPSGSPYPIRAYASVRVASSAGKFAKPA